MKSSSLPSLATLLASAAAASTASAAVLNLNPTQDVYIRGDQATTNQAQNALVLFGAVAGGATGDMRGLFQFDLSNPALAGATINSVNLSFTLDRDGQLNMSAGSASVTETVQLYQLNATFNEAQATWQIRETSVSWTGPGGDGAANDFGPLLGTHQVNPRDFTNSYGGTTTSNATTILMPLDFNTTDLLTSVAGSIGGNVGFMLKIADETNADRSIFRVKAYTGTAGNAAALNSAGIPVLTIDYTPAAIPEPSSFAALAGLALLGFAGARRRR